jgi:PAS domain S-box-containing protein
MQKSFLYERVQQEVSSHAKLLATSSKTWVMSDDVAGLQEVISEFSQDNTINYAMVITPAGQVLGHTNVKMIGLFLVDEQSLHLLNSKPEPKIVFQSELQIEKAHPILFNDKLLGWARLSKNISKEKAHIEYVNLQGLIYTFAAIVIGTIFAFFLSKRLLRQLLLLLAGARRLSEHKLDEPIPVITKNEVGIVSEAFNSAMKQLLDNEIKLLESQTYNRNLFESSSIGLTLNRIDGSFVDVNQAFANIVGYSIEDLLKIKCSDITPEIYKDWMRSLLDSLIDRESFGPVEIKYIHKNGDLIPVQLIGSIIEIKGEKFVWSSIENICERIHSQQLLAEQFSTLNGLIESANAPIFSVNREYRYTSFNGKHKKIMEMIYGVNISLGDSLLQCMTVDEDRKVAKKNLDRALFGEYFEEEAYSGEEIRSRMYFRISHSPIKTNDGTIIGVAVLAHDMTERKRMEETLRESEERFRTMADTAPVLIWMSDINKLYFYFNKVWLEFTGRTFIQERGFGWTDGIHPEDVQQFLDIYNISFEERIVFQSEFRLLRYDGEYRWIINTGTPRFNPGGEFVGYIGTCYDISERKQLVEELHAKSLYTRSLIEASLDPLVTIDADGKITDVNEATELATGFVREKLIGTDFSEYFTKPQNARHGFQEVFRKGTVIDLPLEIQHRDGHVISVLYTASIYKDVNGEVLGVFAAARNITKRKLAEEKAKQLADIVQSSEDAIISKTLDGKIISWNFGAEKIYGYNETEVLGKPISILIPSERIEEAGRITDKILKGEHLEHFESVRLRKDGKKIQMSLTFSGIKNSDGEIVAISVIGRDITEYKLAAAKVKEREEFLFLIIENIPHMIFIKEAKDLKFVRFNKAGEELLGLKRDHLIGKTDFDIFPKDQATFFTGRDRVVLAGGTMLDINEEPINVKGENRILHTKKIPINDITGTPAFLLGISEDITEQKNAEEQIKLSEKRLQEAQRIAHVGSWELNLTTNKLEWSDEIYRIFEIDRNKFEASYDGFLNLIHPDDRNMVNEAYSNSLKDKTQYDIIHRLKFEDGKIKFVHEHCETFYDNDGNALRSLGTVQDITKSKLIEEEIKTLNEELEKRVEERTGQLMAANKELEAFSYSVSHDLRAPLRAIDGFSRILQEDYADKIDEEGKRVCSVISENAQKMGKLIDDLLSFSRISRSDMRVSFINMTNLVNHIYQELTDLQTREKIDFRVDELEDTAADPTLIKQVWLNLISNAIKYSSKNEQITISVSSIISNNKIVYSIKDNGAGFNMKYIQKLFGVFQRLHSSKEFEGTGVGLAIVKRIIYRHGGDVWAEGEINKGATFYFSLPVVNSVLINK